MNNKRIKAVLFILVVFFGLQLVSHFLGELGKDDSGKGGLGMLAWSGRLMPLDADPVFHYGYTLLLANGGQQDNRITLEIIRELKKSLNRNMFDYNAHYYLGKAFLLYDFPQSPYFDRAGESFKRAAFLRGQKNPDIAADTLVLLLSRWPFLNDRDKQFCQELMKESVDQLGTDNFNRVLEAWRLYSRDINFFQGILKKNPTYYLHAARELSRLETHLELRHQFLSRYEVYRLEWLETRYQKEQENPVKLSNRLISLYREAQIDGYYRLVNNSDFNEENYLEFKRKLALHVLRLLISPGEQRTDPGKKKDMVNYIHQYMIHSTSRKHAEILDDLLEKSKFFDSQDFKIFLIKQEIQSRMGNKNAVITDIEKFKQSIAFVKKEHLQDYIDILLFLSDTYFENKLLTRAFSVFEEIENISSGLPGVYWRMGKITSIIGSDGPGDKKGEIANSRVIELYSLNTRKTVYMLDNSEIKIFIHDELKEKIKSHHLLQVFLDGRIQYEAYLSQVNAEGVVIKTAQKTGKYEVLVQIR